jgi:hypothetical protein
MVIDPGAQTDSPVPPRFESDWLGAGPLRPASPQIPFTIPAPNPGCGIVPRLALLLDAILYGLGPVAANRAAASSRH